MKKKTKADQRISIRLTAEQAEALDSIVLQKGFKNRSQAMRAALDEFIGGNTSDWNTEKLKLDMPKLILEELDKLNEFTGVTNRQEAIRSAVRQYIQTENEFLLQRTTHYEELRARYRTGQRRSQELKP